MNGNTDFERHERRRRRYFKLKEAFKLMREYSSQGLIEASGAFNKRRREADRARACSVNNLLSPNFHD